MPMAELKQLDIIFNDHDNEWEMYNWLVGKEVSPLDAKCRESVKRRREAEKWMIRRSTNCSRLSSYENELGTEIRMRSGFIHTSSTRPGPL